MQAAIGFVAMLWLFYGAFLCCAFFVACWYIRARVIAPGIASGTKHLAGELSRIADSLQLIAQQQAVAPHAAEKGHAPPAGPFVPTLPSQKIPTTPGRVFNSMFGRRY